MPDKETNVPQASCDFAGEAHNHELSNEPCLSPMIGGAEKRPRIEDDNTAAEPSSAKKVRLLRELEGLKKREEELNNEDELRDLEREVEAAHKRIQDREIKTVLKIARDTSPGQKEQLQSSLSEGTLSMTNAHSGTESNRPLSVVPQTAAGHSTGHTEAHPRNSITIMDSEIPAGNSNYPTRETMSTPSLDKLDRLEYYKEVDENKSRLLQGMDIPELRRLAASEPDSLQDLEQATSIIHVYYSLFLKAGAMKDLERAIQLANEQMPSNADSPDYTPHLKDLIVMLVKKYQCTNSLSALQEAIFRAQEMVVATPPSHSNHVTRVRDFITMMLMKFGRTGSQDDLDEATIIAREVGATVSIDDSDGRGRVIKVGIPVSGRAFGHNSNSNVQLAETTTALTPRNATNIELFNIEAELAAVLNNMSHEDLHSFAEMQDPARNEQIELYIYTHFLIFTKTQSTESLDQAIQQTEGWLAVTPTDHPDRTCRFHVLDVLVVRKH